MAKTPTNEASNYQGTGTDYQLGIICGFLADIVENIEKKEKESGSGDKSKQAGTTANDVAFLGGLNSLVRNAQNIGVAAENIKKLAKAIKTFNKIGEDGAELFAKLMKKIFGVFDKFKNIKHLNKVAQTIKQMNKLLWSIVGIAAILVILAIIDWKLLLLGIGALIITVLLVAGLFKILVLLFPKKKMQNISKSVNAITRAFVEITATLLVIMIISLFFDWKTMAKGLVMTIAILALAIGALWLIGKIGTSEFFKSTAEGLVNIGIALLIFTLDLLLLALIVKFVPAALLWEALAIMAIFLGGMTAFIWGISAINKMYGAGTSLDVAKALLYITGVLIILTFDLLILALMVKYFGLALIAEAAAIMAGLLGLVVGIIVVLDIVGEGTIGARESALAVASLLLSINISFIICLYIVENYDLVTIGLGGLLLMTLLGIAVGIVILLNHTLKKNEVTNAIAIALAVAILIGSVIVSVVAFVFISEYISNHNISLGAFVITGLIMAAMLTAVIVVLKILSNIPKSELVKGGAILAIVSVFLGGLLILTFAFVKLAQYIDEVSDGKDKLAFFGTPGLIMAALLGAMAAIILGMGAITLIPFAGIIIAAGIALTASLEALLFGLIGLTRQFAEVAHMIDEYNITTDTLTQFVEITGDGTYGKGLLGIMRQIMDNISGFSYGQFYACQRTIDMLKDLLDVVSKFMDIVLKFANFQYIKEYTQDGKPVYGKYSPEDFKTAADAISSSFCNFLLYMSIGLEMIIPTMDKIGWWFLYKLNKIVDIVGKFVNIVLQLATSTYIIAYDEKDKPIYKKVTDSDFADAASVISSSFKTFLENLKAALSDQSVIDTIEDISSWFIRSLGGLIKVIGDFAKVITDFITLVIPDYNQDAHPGEKLVTDDGKPRFFRRIKDEEFKTAANAVTTAFTTFLIELAKALKSEVTRNNIEAAIEALEGINPVLEGIANLASAVIDLAGMHPYLKDENGNILYLTDKDGKPDYTKPRLDYSKVINSEWAGQRVAKLFTGFLSAMLKCMEDENFADMVEEMMDMFNEGDFRPGLENIIKMSNMIINVSKELSKNTEDAKIYDMMQDLAANGVPKLLNTFVTTIINFLQRLSSEPVVKSLGVMKDMGRNLKDAASSISKFVETIVDICGTVQKLAKNDNSDLKTFSAICDDLIEGIAAFADDMVTIAAKNFKKTSDLLNKAVGNIKSFARTVEELLDDVSDLDDDSKNFIIVLKRIQKGISVFTNDYLKVAAANVKSCSINLMAGSINLRAVIFNIKRMLADFTGDDFKGTANQFVTMCKYIIKGISLFSNDDVIDNVDSFKTVTDTLHKSISNLQSFTDTIYNIITKFENQETGIGSFNVICKKLTQGIQEFSTVALPENELTIARALNVYEKDLKRFTDSNEKMNKSVIDSTISIKKFSNAIRELQLTLAREGVSIGEMMNKTTEKMKEMILQMSYLIGGMKNIANTDFNNTSSALKNIKEEILEIIERMEQSGMTEKGSNLEGGDSELEAGFNGNGNSQLGNGNSTFVAGAAPQYAPAGGGGAGNGDVNITGISNSVINAIKRALQA